MAASRRDEPVNRLREVIPIAINGQDYHYDNIYLVAQGDMVAKRCGIRLAIENRESRYNRDQVIDIIVCLS